MDDNLLNATNTAIGAVAVVLLARALGSVPAPALILP